MSAEEITHNYIETDCINVFFQQKKQKFTTESNNSTLSETKHTIYDLCLQIIEGDNELHGSFKYAKNIFIEKTISQILKHLKTLLDQFKEKYNLHLTELRLISQEDYNKIIVEWNNTEIPQPKERHDKRIHKLFEQQAKIAPTDTCMIFEKSKLSNQQVNSRANNLAEKIQTTIKNRNFGQVPIEACVILCCQPGFENNIAALSIFKAGCVYVPVNHDEAQNRIDHIVQETNAQAILTTRNIHQFSNTEDRAFIFLDELTLDDENPHNPDNPSVNADSIAYIIYTSGTTGKPKGVKISHKAISERVWTFNSTHNLNMNDVWLQRSSHAFDLSIWEMFGSMSVSGTLVIANKNERMNPYALIQLIEDYSVSIAIFIPITLDLLCRYLKNHNERIPKTLKLLVSTGAILTLELCGEILKLCDHPINFLNIYGPTETFIATSYKIDQKYHKNNHPTVPIGKPLPNTKLYVLDSCRQPLPTLIPGELYIGGASLGSGYLNRQDLSEKCFIKNAFATDNDINLGYTHLYKTGDRVLWLDNGELIFINRFDNQTKIRGYRIEPSEIEIALENIENITKAIVLPQSKPDCLNKKNSNFDFLVAWYTGKLIPKRDLLTQLKNNLPEYMIPSQIHHLNEFPLTSNGKVDINKLVSYTEFN